LKQEILLLSPVNSEKNNPTKILDKDLNKLQSFNSGKYFYFELLEYTDFHEAMKMIFEEPECFMVLGELTTHGRLLYNAEEAGRRTKKQDDPTIQDREGTEIVLDLDDHILEKFNPLKPEPAIKAWLKERNINCDVTWQITSGQKLKTNEARIRLFFTSLEPHSLAIRKAWSQSPTIRADGSVYTASQPIYTAPPVIRGGVDPIPKRYGFIKGVGRTFKIPKQTVEEIKQNSRDDRGSSEFDFSDHTLPEEVKSGEVYRRYFMPLAFHYANLLKCDREAVFAIIYSKCIGIKNREFNAENTYAYIDDAINIIKNEVIQDESEIENSEDQKERIIEVIPEFPENVMDSWPEPWPMIWRNIKQIPRELSEPLLVPTILSTNAYLLQANFVTSMNRRPNMFFLNLTPSTGNKDVNSKNVIEDLDTIFRNHGGVKTTPFTGIINGESTITADISFLQSFDSEENLFWVNTEATRIFQQLSTSGNANVSALSDKLIEVVDGRKIGGKRKVKDGSAEIADPNCQVLFYAQPETIERYITAETVDSGLFGRTMLSIIPDLAFDVDKFDMFGGEGAFSKTIEEEFYHFYMSNEFMYSKTDNKRVLQPKKAAIDLMNIWARENFGATMKDDDALQKVLKRLGIAGEQLYLVVLAVCQTWDKYKDQEIRTSIPVGCLFPLLEYWGNTKIFAINNYVNTTLDPMADEVLEIIRECLSGLHMKDFKKYDRAILLEKNLVSMAVFNRILSRRKALVRKLEATNDKRNATSTALRLIEMMVRHGILVQKEQGNKKLIGISK